MATTVLLCCNSPAGLPQLLHKLHLQLLVAKYWHRRRPPVVMGLSQLPGLSAAWGGCCTRVLAPALSSYPAVVVLYVSHAAFWLLACLAIDLRGTQGVLGRSCAPRTHTSKRTNALLVMVVSH